MELADWWNVWSLSVHESSTLMALVDVKSRSP